MQNQNELKCDGCGQQFSNRNDLEKHRQTCAAVRAKGGSAQQGQGQTHQQGQSGGQQGQSHQQGQTGGQQEQPRTQGAGGGHNPQR